MIILHGIFCTYCERHTWSIEAQVWLLVQNDLKAALMVRNEEEIRFLNIFVVSFLRFFSLLGDNDELGS